MKKHLTLLTLYTFTAIFALGAAEKRLPIKGEVFSIEDHTAFLILPDKPRADQPIPWLWYAPTLRGLPGGAEKWMFERFLNAGIAIAGVDVGESYGNPKGRKIYSALHKHLVSKRAMARQACLLARSRGGLMLYCWAAENPEKVRCITGIYPVCNIASYPGIKRACGAYGLNAEQLEAELAKHNPIDRLASLARAKVSIFHIHGDKDGVVPLDKNSAIIKQRYDQLGGPMILEVVKGQGHNMWDGWFQSQNLVDFVIKHATKPLQKKTSPASAKIQPAQGPVTLVGGPGKGKPVDKVKVAQLEKSLQLWKKLKEKCRGNYTYSKRWSSWVGFGNVTEVVVANNKVVERNYKAFSAPPRPVAPGKPPEKRKETGWSEKGVKLGSHKEGHPAKTIDQLYEEAKSILARPLPAFQRLGLRFDKQGLLLACYTQDTRIADDAPTKGVNISTITLGKGGKNADKLDRQEPAHPVLRLSKDANGKTVKALAGQKIAINLAGNPTTGFTWNDTTRSEIVKLSGDITHRASNRAIGAPGISTATFEAIKNGRGTIILEYRRIFENKPAAETFRVNLIVKSGAKTSPAGDTSNKATP